MGDKCSKNGKHVNSVQNFNRETLGKKPLGRPRLRWEDHSDLKDIEWSM